MTTIRWIRTLSLLGLYGAFAACGGSDLSPPANASAPKQSMPPVAAPATAPGAAAPAPASGADAPQPASASALTTTKTDDAWASCHQRYQGAGREFRKAEKNRDVVREVAEMAEGCKAVTKLQLVGRTMSGEGAEKATQSFPIDAKANHCYRVYAQSTDDVLDLDVVVKDSAGEVVGQDSTDDPSPVVDEDGAVCFTRDDKASAVVTIDKGKGKWALQIWSD